MGLEVGQAKMGPLFSAPIFTLFPTPDTVPGLVCMAGGPSIGQLAPLLVGYSICCVLFHSHTVP